MLLKFENIKEFGFRTTICAFFPQNRCWYMIYWNGSRWVYWNGTENLGDGVDVHIAVDMSTPPSHFIPVSELSPQ